MIKMSETSRTLAPQDSHEEKGPRKKTSVKGRAMI